MFNATTNYVWVSIGFTAGWCPCCAEIGWQESSRVELIRREFLAFRSSQHVYGFESRCKRCGMRFSEDSSLPSRVRPEPDVDPVTEVRRVEGEDSGSITRREVTANVLAGLATDEVRARLLIDVGFAVSQESRLPDYVVAPRLRWRMLFGMMLAGVAGTFLVVFAILGLTSLADSSVQLGDAFWISVVLSAFWVILVPVWAFNKHRVSMRPGVDFRKRLLSRGVDVLARFEPTGYELGDLLSWCGHNQLELAYLRPEDLFAAIEWRKQGQKTEPRA